MITTALVLLLTTAAPAPASAPVPPAADLDAARAKEAFQWAQRLYKQARYTEAIEKFEEAYRFKPHPSIFFNIGRCYEQIPDIPKALRNYREYLKALPDAKDKELVTDAITNLERRLHEQGVQQLLVYSDPPGAQVTVDGKKYGNSPTSAELRSGNHSVTLTKEGFETIERSFVMPAEKSMELSFGLKAGTGKSVEPTPPVPEKDVPRVEAPKPELTPPPTPPPEVAAAAPAKSSPRGKAWIPAVGAGLLLAGGGVFYGLAKGSEGRLTGPDPTGALAKPADRAALASSGQTQQTVAFVLGGAGIAALAVAATMFFWPSGSSDEPEVSFVVTPQSGAAVISGAF